MEKQITVTSKEFDKAVGDMTHDLIQRGASADKVIAAMVFSFAVFDQLYAEHGTKTADTPKAKVEPLTDTEQRIFLAAMSRELKVCEELEKKEADTGSVVDLVVVCREIERKVKKALWTN